MRTTAVRAVWMAGWLVACSPAGGGGGGGGGGGSDATATDTGSGSDATAGNDATRPGDSTTGTDGSRPPGDGGNTCQATGCGTCTPLPGCGWCRRTNSCVPGGAMGSTAGGCTGADWAYLPSDCGGDGGVRDGSAIDCSRGSMSCGACTPLPGCGWCRRTNSCVPGGSSGSTAGGCMGADWAYTVSDCGGSGDGGVTCSGTVPRACNLTMAGAARTCTPGQMVTVGCNQGCNLGSCTGDAVLQICPGNATAPCATAIASNDDAPASAMCGARDGGTADAGGDAGLDPARYCPLTTFMCPADGRYTVWVGAYGTGMATCMPAAR